VARAATEALTWRLVSIFTRVPGETMTCSRREREHATRQQRKHASNRKSKKGKRNQISKRGK
jgi:hypothetical protein